MLQGYIWLEHVGTYWNVKRLKVLFDENVTVTVAMCHECTRAFTYLAEHFPFRWYKMTRKLYRKSCVSLICIHIKCHLNSPQWMVFKVIHFKASVLRNLKLDLIMKRMKWNELYEVQEVILNMWYMYLTYANMLMAIVTLSACVCIIFRCIVFQLTAFSIIL